MYQGSFKGVSRKSQKSFKEVSMCSKKVSRVFYKSFKSISKKIEGFKGVPSKFLGCSKEVSRVFQEIFKEE